MAKEKRNATIAWLERSNPLKGLSISAANNIFDAARTGDTQRLHWMYSEIETANPVLSMCVTRRSGAAANFRWKVSERAAFDDTLASEQRDAVERFLGGIVNLADTFEHLDLALFRGFSHAQPIWEEDGTVREIALLDSWKFLKKDGAWFYNPACDGFTGSCESCEDARLITVERRRPVDVPALALHLRAAVGSRDWGRFIERYALPKPAVVMSPNATGNDRNDYQQSANALENGQVTVWPSGTSLMDFAGGSRGVDPFTAFITHQEKTILMLATGGTLGSMAEAGSGTLAGNAQQDVWESIVSRDSGVISAAMMRDLIRPYLEATFPGQKIAVEFGFDLTHNPSPKEVFEIAAAAKAAGYIINQEQLEEKTGFKLEKAPESASMGGGMMLNRRDSADTPLQNDENRLQNASTALNEQVDPLEETPSQIAKKRPNNQLKNGETQDPLATALESLFEESLAEAAAEEIANSECRAENPVTSRVHGTPDKKDLPNENPKIADASGAGTTTGSGTVDAPGASAHVPATAEVVEKFKAELPNYISPAEFDSILTTGFEDTDGAGNKVMYGTLLRDHINNDRRNAEDLGARKRELGNIVRIIRETKPVATTRAGGKERIYTGYKGDKAYIAVADEHNEIGAFVMVSYRRDGKHDKK